MEKDVPFSEKIEWIKNLIVLLVFVILLFVYMVFFCATKVMRFGGNYLHDKFDGSFEKKIAWVADFIPPIVFGAIVFSSLYILNCPLNMNIFWTIAALYLFLSGTAYSERFDNINIIIGPTIFAFGVIGAIFFKGYLPFIYPIIYGGLVSLFTMCKEELDLDGGSYYDYPYN